MQQAMKVQQQYAGLVARGDELFTGIRGEDEPGLATFDDDVEPVTVTPPGFRDSAFDRAAETSASDAATYAATDADQDELPADPAADAVADAAVEELADQVDDGADVPGRPGRRGAGHRRDPRRARHRRARRPGADARRDRATAADTLDAEPTADVATTADVLTPDGEVTPVDATVTDEAAAVETERSRHRHGRGRHAGRRGDRACAPTWASPTPRADDAAIAEGAAVDAVGGDLGRADRRPAGGSELSGSQAAGAAPIDGYDSFSIAQLRGRLRGYALSTVQDLVAYEEATRARAPVPEDAAQPAGEGRGAGGRVEPAGPPRRLTRPARHPRRRGRGRRSRRGRMAPSAT